MRFLFDGFRNSANVLIYALLTVITYILLYGIILEYLEGKTDFLVSKQLVNIEDNPAVLVEFREIENIQYGVDYNVTVLDWDESSQDYIQNPNDYIVYHDRYQDNVREQGNFGIDHFWLILKRMLNLFIPSQSMKGSKSAPMGGNGGKYIFCCSNEYQI